MNGHGPPGPERGAAPGRATEGSNSVADGNEPIVPRQLRRRRDAALRSVALDDGRRDPWDRLDRHDPWYCPCRRCVVFRAEARDLLRRAAS